MPHLQQYLFVGCKPIQPLKMFEGIILIIFFIIGGLTALLALYFFVIALVRQSKTMFHFGLVSSIVPLFLYVLTFWYYDIHIPSFNKREEIKYVGIYASDTGKEITDNGLPDKKSFKLTLNSDNTFELEENQYLNFSGKGTWKAGGTDDGQFTFEKDGAIIFWATPYNTNRLEIETNSESKVIFYKN